MVAAAEAAEGLGDGEGWASMGGGRVGARVDEDEDGDDTTAGAEEDEEDYESDEESTDEEDEEGGDPDGPPLVYVLNLVNTKQDNTVKR